ncbi:MAG: UvrD-helicase domain-containing protein [Planctomycetota bacterium]
MSLDWMDVERAREDEGQDPASLLEGLNEPQQRAVEHGEGPLLILAGAGSGKTRVITRRIAWLVATGRARPDEILAITFTNKAAREMRSRVAAMRAAKGMWIATFHATCARILRRDIELLGPWTRDFSIYDTADKNQLLKTLIKEAGWDPKRFRPQVISHMLGEWKASQFDTERQAAPDGLEGEVFATVRDLYEARMRAANALDFDDLLVRTLELFRAQPGVLDQYAHRFRYVLVDEYQDTNHVQYLLTRALAGWHGNLAVCGDPDQSIYAWRGANVANILDFERDFSTPERAVAVVKLEQNYRSTPGILGAAQAVIRHNAGRKEKDLWTEKEDVDPVRIVECGDEEDEANEIAARIHGLRQSGVPLDEIAIFYRVNFMQRALERGLRLSGVPYQIVGGLEFYQRREIKDLVSYLQVLVNPADDVATRRIINVPARGVGDKSVALLEEFARDRRISLAAAIESEEARARVRGVGRKGLTGLARLLEDLGGLRDGPAHVALVQILEETDYFVHLAKGEDAEGSSRAENVEELLAHAERWDAENPEGGVRGFLQEVALVSDVDGWDPDAERVSLLTLHSSKGLEFGAVFLAGCEEELLPHVLALEEGDGGLEEERRLFYVGMTRAKERLCLSWARTRMRFGETSWREPSRFLSELPDELLETDESEAEAREADVLGDFDGAGAGADLSVGDWVEHDHFGLGQIRSLEGSAVNARATVQFREAGQRILLLQYANLKRVGN